jgi:hypothetical protein
MDDHALRDYDYVEWNGRAPFVAAPLNVPEPIVIDTSEIWLASEREMRYWTTELGVTVYALRDAINEAGTRCSIAVRAYLERVGAS